MLSRTCSIPLAGWARSTLSTSALLVLALSCRGDEGNEGDPSQTSEVGTFSGRFDNVVTGFNFPFDIAIAPGKPHPDDAEEDPEAADDLIAPGVIVVANYGTSELMLAGDPTDEGGGQARSLLDGTSVDLRGATAVSMTPDRFVWGTFEQGGEGDGGAIVVLEPVEGRRVQLLDGTLDRDAFRNPAGVCFGGAIEDDEGNQAEWFWFFVNLGDGTAWRVNARDTMGTDPSLTRVGGGLAIGTPGRPGSPGNEITSSNDLPQDGARGCAFHDGNLYVADAQNARIVRFDRAHDGRDLEPVVLEDTPPELVTYPTDVTVNSEGVLIVISYDNAHAFVTLELPYGGFLDNGLHDLNVNSGNYGTAVASETIWFTRANNKNGSLRAITPDHDHTPETYEPFFPQ
ncbi:NHL repeat-containing protein [Paraliomyxa miuraensis]|uniref:hypothetical protein n=1 Tax=Paraliomyxa miuraensis TaxID=376150 RepID=UPI0022569F11|nr:hypothetical protein [Paraliomyxa miuraensis]MCX4239157.1 hypothetical protein [Paraliomyxa miuraensis]